MRRPPSGRHASDPPVRRALVSSAQRSTGEPAAGVQASVSRPPSGRHANRLPVTRASVSRPTSGQHAHRLLEVQVSVSRPLSGRHSRRLPVAQVSARRPLGGRQAHRARLHRTLACRPLSGRLARRLPVTRVSVCRPARRSTRAENVGESFIQRPTQASRATQPGAGASTTHRSTQRAPATQESRPRIDRWMVGSRTFARACRLCERGGVGGLAHVGRAWRCEGRLAVLPTGRTLWCDAGHVRLVTGG